MYKKQSIFVGSIETDIIINRTDDGTLYAKYFFKDEMTDKHIFCMAFDDAAEYTRENLNTKSRIEITGELHEKIMAASDGTKKKRYCMYVKKQVLINSKIYNDINVKTVEVPIEIEGIKENKTMNKKEDRIECKEKTNKTNPEKLRLRNFNKLESTKTLNKLVEDAMNANDIDELKMISGKLYLEGLKNEACHLQLMAEIASYISQTQKEEIREAIFNIIGKHAKQTGIEVYKSYLDYLSNDLKTRGIEKVKSIMSRNATDIPRRINLDYSILEKLVNFEKMM